jgi:hypothetical protein
MTLRDVRYTVSLAILVVALMGCTNDGGGSGPPVGFNDFDAGTAGCSQPIFPAEQPDISPFAPPRFVTSSGETQRSISPGRELFAEITVNAATRKVLAKLSDGFEPDRVVATADVDTPGNETIPVSFFPPASTRVSFYYMRLTLCGSDCDEREVLFDITEPDPDNMFDTGINANYERTLIEDRDVVQVDQTCVRPNSVLIQ